MDEASENESRVNIPLNEEPSNPENDTMEELKSKYKEFFVTYGDENTKYFNG